MHVGKDLIFSLANLALLIIVLVYFFRRPILAAFKSRSKNLEIRRGKASKHLSEAEGEHKEYYQQLQNINQHMAQLMKRAELEGEEEGEQMLIQMEKVADGLITQSMNRADQVVKKKNLEFFGDIAGRSISEAQMLIKKKMTTEKQILLGRQFLKQLVAELENRQG
jgi:F0F1-type ATP synthase membrane subunit b/b'